MFMMVSPEPSLPLPLMERMIINLMPILVQTFERFVEYFLKKSSNINVKIISIFKLYQQQFLFCCICMCIFSFKVQFPSMPNTEVSFKNNAVTKLPFGISGGASQWVNFIWIIKFKN